MADLIAVEVDGIPVSIDPTRMGKMSVMRTFARTMDEGADDLSRAIAALDWAEAVLGAEQVDNIKWSLDGEEGDPDGAQFIQFVMRCVQAASAERSAEAKN